VFYRYRSGLQPQESEVIRQLRRRGYAVVLLSPRDVGPAVNRVCVEGAMLRAGKSAASRKEKAK
jgi:hypothetical protein